MNHFQYYAPTKIIFGRGAADQAGQQARSFGASRVLLHYGGKSALRSGLIERVKQSLKDAGFSVTTLGGVVPNPRLSLVRQGIELCRQEKIDFLLAVGGGSVIDSAKAIAVALAQPEPDLWDLFLRKAPVTAALPVGVVLTLAAAGSEMSSSCVITNEETGLKKSIGSDLIRPRFALMDPELTMTLPPYQTAAGVVDIMMHTLERYFAAGRGNDLSDRIAEQLLRTVIEWGPKCLSDPYDYRARSEIMWAGSLSHNGLTGLGNSGGFSCHPIEHELSGMFDVTHGAGLAVVWCQWARYVYERDIDRFIQYAIQVWNCTPDPVDRRNTALEGILRTERFFQDLGMPVTNAELGVGTLTQAQMETMANRCTQNGTICVGPVISLSKEDIITIYAMGNQE